MPTFVIILIVAIIFINGIAKADQRKRRAEAQQAAQKNAQPSAQAAQLEAQRRAAAEAERRRAPMSPSIRPSVQSASAGWHCRCGKDNVSGTAFCVKCGRKREEAMSGSLAYYSGEGEATDWDTEGRSGRGDTEGVSSEGRNVTGDLVATKSSLRHTVKSSSESRHIHTEEAISGEGETCGEEYDQYTHDSYDQIGDAYSQIAGDSYAQNAGDAYAHTSDVEGLPFGLVLQKKSDLARGLLYSEILGKPKALKSR